MANTVTNTNNLSLRSILEKDKLTGSNFLDWERNLQIVLSHERKWYVLEEPLGEAPPANASAAIRNAYQKRSDDLLDVGSLMLVTMSPELQTGLINTNAYDMIHQLRDMFQTQARTERYDAIGALNACKMAKGTSVSAHVMKMKRHLDHLERLGHPVPLQLATDTILNSLSDDYKQFVINYNMNNMEKTIAELHSMLKTAELSMGTKTKDVLMVKDGGVKKKRGHMNTSKGKGQVQVSQSVPKAVDNSKNKGKGKKVKVNKARTENRCFRCHEVGHWRQNCPKRHETDSAYFEKKAAVMKKKEQGKVMLADEEDWIMEPEDSDDEGPSAVQGLCLMADFEEPCISGSPNDSTDEEAEVHSCSLVSKPDDLSKSETLRLESQLQMERALVARFRIESAVYKSSLEDLTENFNRMELESGIRESILENKLLDLQRSHDEIESSREELKLKFHILS
ncbi:hypothetical protein OSB04_028190 [Centaurea solstitialis]|uniref:CCHC-type domain-containing protein n=1 Tax=Centaurea solstitialis TaxID=347529 RepID=A0AA38W900_9ASTR|nr:hypothetical protein OSB04_028190 [Centaurea solstitialis]